MNLLKIGSFTNEIKIILTKILNNFLNRNQNKYQYTNKIKYILNSLLKTQLYIIFKNQELFDDSKNYINIQDTKLNHYINKIKIFFETDNDTNKHKGINFIINKKILNQQYKSFITTQIKYYDLLYDNIRYNEKIISFINSNFQKSDIDNITNIIKSLQKYDDIYKEYDIEIIKNNTSNIRNFLKAEYKNKEDKQIFIISQQNIIENKITKFISNFNKTIDYTEEDLNIESLKPNDISMLSLEENPEKIWTNIISEHGTILQDQHPLLYFTNFVKLCDYLRNVEIKYSYDDNYIKNLNKSIQTYIDFLNKKKEIILEISLNNSGIFEIENNQDEIQEFENILKYLKKIPDDDKKILSGIIPIIDTLIENLFININSKFDYGYKVNTDNDNVIQDDLYKNQYYNKMIGKLQVSYNTLLIYLNKCNTILEQKKSININKHNVLPQSIYPEPSYKYPIETYSYIINKIFKHINHNYLVSQDTENFKKKALLLIVYYKQFINYKNISKNFLNDYDTINKTLSSKSFKSKINFIIIPFIENSVKSTIHINDLLKNILFNMEDLIIPVRNNSLFKKIKLNKEKLDYIEYLSLCEDTNNNILKKKYFAKYKNSSDFIKTIKNKYIKELLSKEKNNDLEWNIMMNNNMTIFISYFSNLDEKINLYSNQNIQTFKEFNNINECNDFNTLNEKYVSCYEKNFYQWINLVKKNLPINFIERYTNIYQKYLNKNLYKIIDNRIILLEINDEIKYYKTIKTKIGKENFIILAGNKKVLTQSYNILNSNLKIYNEEKSFYDNLIKISLSDKSILDYVLNYIKKIEKDIEELEKIVSSLKILIENIDDEQLLIDLKNKELLLNNKKIFLEHLVEKSDTFNTKFDQINSFDDEDDFEFEYIDEKVVEEENNEEEDNYEGDGEYGEDNEPNENDEVNLEENINEFNDFEQQTRVNVEDFRQSQKRNKRLTIKLWIKTLYQYLDLESNSSLIDKIMQIVDNSEYKSSMQKKIYNTFAIYLKNEFIANSSLKQIKRIKYDQKIKKLYYEFLNKTELDILKIVLILNIITFELEKIIKKGFNVCSPTKLKNFIKGKQIEEKTTESSNFIQIVNGRWKGYTGTLISNDKYDEVQNAKKNIIKNLKSVLYFYKKLKKNFNKNNLRKKIIKEPTKKMSILENDVLVEQNEFFEEEISNFENKIDTIISDIEIKKQQYIDEYKNKKVYITLDRFGVRGTKYVPHIKQIGIKVKDIIISKLDDIIPVDAITIKYEEIKEDFINKKTLFDLTKCLYKIIYIFHSSTSSLEYQEIFKKNYFIYIYNFAFEIYQKSRIREKRLLLTELEDMYNIESLQDKLKQENINKLYKKRLERTISRGLMKKRYYEVEDKYSDIFDIIVDKKQRKENVSVFQNLYIDKRGNILPEYQINAMKNIDNVNDKKEKVLLEQVKNVFSEFVETINIKYEKENCNLIKLFSL